MFSQPKITVVDKEAHDTNSELNTEYLLLYFGSDGNNVQVKKLLYRGDARFPDQIFKQGFTARGTSTDIFNHFHITPNHIPSGLIPTTNSKDVALTYPRGKPFKHPPQGFIYEINMQKNAVDVNPHVYKALNEKLITPENAKSYLADNEMAVPYKIKARDIKGAWAVKIEETAIKDQPYVRVLTDTYVPNPSYINSVILNTANKIGRGVTAFGIAFDGSNLIEAYKASQSTNNFKTFFREGARILGAWSSAFASARMGGQAGAAIGTLVGPVGTTVGAIGGSIAGSILGYTAGGFLVEQGYEQGRKLPSIVKEAHAKEIEASFNNFKKILYESNVDQDIKFHEVTDFLKKNRNPENILNKLNDKEIEKTKTILKSQNNGDLIKNGGIIVGLEEHLNFLQEKLNFILDEQCYQDLNQFQTEESVLKSLEELQALKENHAQPEEIFLKEKQIKNLKKTILWQRYDFTEKLKLAADSISTFSNIMGILGEAPLAYQVNVVSQSFLTIFENVSGLMGIGVLAGSPSPFMAFAGITQAVFNIVGIFKPRDTQIDYSPLILNAIRDLAFSLERFKQDMHQEFANLSHRLNQQHLQTFQKFIEISQTQADIISLLEYIYFDMKNGFKNQDGKLQKISNQLLNIEVKINSLSYRQDVDKLKENLRYIVQNTVFDYNRLMNELDHLGLENSLSHQVERALDLSEDAKPLEYFQAINYFANLLNDQNSKINNPLLVLYASVANVIMTFKEHPTPHSTFQNDRILKRDVLRLKAYAEALTQIETFMTNARNQQFIDRLISKYESAATKLAAAIKDKSIEIEYALSREKQLFIDSQTSDAREADIDYFKRPIQIETYDWFKGTEEFKHRYHLGKQWYTIYPNLKPYTHQPELNGYLQQLEGQINQFKYNWIATSRDHQQESRDNHLSAYEDSKISDYHGTRFIKPKNISLPVLPAPDPLLPNTHKQFSLLRSINEAQALGLGATELFYDIDPENKKFTLEIYFKLLASKDSQSTGLLLLGSIELNDLDLHFYNQNEGVWNYWVGGKIVTSKVNKNKEWHEGHKITHHEACRGYGYGHRNGEFKFTAWRISIPKDAQLVLGKMHHLTNVNSTEITVQKNNIKLLKKISAQEKIKLRKNYHAELKKNYLYLPNDDFGKACSDFEEAYRNLYGILSLVYFDSLQNEQSNLSQWFLNHTINIKRLREFSEDVAPYDALKNLILDLPVLKKHIASSNNLAHHFSCLKEVNSVLQDFISLYEPNAVENNQRLPSIKQKDDIANSLIERLTDMIQDILVYAPPEIAEGIIRKNVEKLATDSSLDESGKEELLSKISEKLQTKLSEMPKLITDNPTASMFKPQASSEQSYDSKKSSEGVVSDPCRENISFRTSFMLFQCFANIINFKLEFKRPYLDEAVDYISSFFIKTTVATEKSHQTKESPSPLQVQSFFQHKFKKKDSIGERMDEYLSHFEEDAILDGSEKDITEIIEEESLRQNNLLGRN